MDRDIVKFNFFNLENIIFYRKKIYHPDCENISLRYKPLNNSKSTEMNFNTTWMKTSFGVKSYNNVKKKKFYIDLSFNGMNKSIYIKQLYNIICKIDNYIPYMIENKNIKLIKRNLNDYTYIPNIKIIEREPAIKLKIFPETVKIILVDDLYPDDLEIPPGFKPHDDKPRRDIPLESIDETYEVRAKIHCHSIWIMDKKYGLTWIAKELYVRKRKNKTIDYRSKFIKRMFHEENIGDRIYSKSI